MQRNQLITNDEFNSMIASATRVRSESNQYLIIRQAEETQLVHWLAEFSQYEFLVSWSTR